MSGSLLYLCQDVLEHLWLVAWLVVFERTLTTWTSCASVLATWSAAVLTTRTTVVTTVIVTAWATVSARLALRLDVSLRLLEESLAGESHLACLLVDLEELHIYLVTYVKNILYLLGLLPIDL